MYDYYVLQMTSARKDETMQDDQVKRFTLRIENNLFEQIKIKAKENKRAIGKEIEFILENSLKK